MSERFRSGVDPWQFDDSEFYDLESHHEWMRFLLRYAVLAPSGHNTQPWAFRIAKDGVEVYADYTRRLRTVDPGDRELLMSVGAAITNFRVAAAHFGIDTTVLYDSHSEESARVAMISVSETCAADKQLAQLFRAIRKRRTNRALFNTEPIDPDALSRVCNVVDRFPDTLQFTAMHDKTHVASLIEIADRMQMARPEFRAEIADWIRANDDEHTNRRLAESAAALVLVTSDDDRVSLVSAGERLEVLLLTIANTGLQYSFLNQPIKEDTMRDQLGALVRTAHRPQLLIRIGSAMPVEQAMTRRPLEHVVA